MTLKFIGRAGPLAKARASWNGQELQQNMMWRVNRLMDTTGDVSSTFHNDECLIYRVVIVLSLKINFSVYNCKMH